MKKKAKIKERIKEKYRCPNNELFTTALMALVVFLGVELFIRIYNLYKYIPLVDVPSHIFAGIALGTGFYWILSLNQVYRKQFTTVLFTFIGAVVWEALETLEQLVIENPPWMVDVFFWDGFWDIIITVIGGYIGLAVVNYRLKQIR